MAETMQIGAEQAAVMSYWRRRSLLLRESEYNNGVEFAHAIDSLYTDTIKDVEKDLAEFYARLAANNEISITAARKYLTSAELPGFRLTLKEYQRIAEEIDLPDEYKKMLENASLKMRISRLEAVKVQMQQHATVLMKTEMDALDYFIQNTYLHSFAHGAYEIFTGAGFTFKSIGVDADTVARLVKKPWAADGKNFSERIWGDHRPRLINALSQNIGKMIARGEAPDSAIKAIAKDFQTAKSNAVRLVQTEAAYFAEQAKVDMFNELGVEEYEFASSLSEKTCEECGALDGKHWKMSEKEPGVNFPPIHPHCTICTTIPYVDPKELESNTRTAKDANGKTVRIPRNMKYEEWRKLYLQGGKTGDILPPEKADTGFDKKTVDFWNRVKKNQGALEIGEASSVTPFVPAKSIKEATEWTFENRADKVNWKGMSVDVVNVINKEMYDLRNQFSILDDRYKTVGKNGRMSAIAWANSSLMEVNPEYFTKDYLDGVPEVIGKRRAKLERELNGWKKETEETERKKRNAIRKLEESLKYARFTVDSAHGAEGFIRGTVIHETGHTILFRTGKVNKDAFDAVNKVLEKAKSTGDIYKISEYASTDLHEFFAETFTMYRLEKDNLPDYIIKMIEEIAK